MKPKIVVRKRDTLQNLIYQEIDKNGNNCDLNHIDISQITNLSYVFANTEFNGDISQWNTSKVEEMRGMFLKSSFNGDISRWDVSKVKYMNSMFAAAKFNGDISNWSVYNVTDMNYMFENSQFNQDLSNWRPFSLYMKHATFNECNAPLPYWFNIEDQATRQKAIQAYLMSMELKGELSENSILIKKLKI